MSSAHHEREAQNPFNLAGVHRAWSKTTLHSAKSAIGNRTWPQRQLQLHSIHVCTVPFSYASVTAYINVFVSCLDCNQGINL